MARLPRIVSLVSGLGLAFGESRSWKRACMNRVVQAMYRMAGRRVERTWFQNPDDLATFVSRGLLRADQAVLIRGSGVDVSEFRPDAVGESELDRLRAELGLCPDTFVVLMVARMLWSKGIREFVEASRSADALGRPVKFVLVGPVDGSGALSNTGNPELVPREFLEKARSASFVWLGLRDDVRSLLGLADLAVLPSYYPEGVPRFLLEAAAMGKPIVTCDSAGCREAVANGENGILVPPRDVKALRAAIGRFVRDDDLREQSGQASRRLAVECYDAVTVARRVISEVYCQKSTAPSTEPVHCH